MLDYREFDTDRPRFELDKRKPRVKITCPSCGRPKCFTPVVDVTTGEMVGPEFGICDHVNKCGYKRWPTGKDVKGKELFVDSNKVLKAFAQRSSLDIANRIPESVFMETLNPSLPNTLRDFLSTIFDPGQVSRTFDMYKVGTTSLWNWMDCAVFWQIDKDWRVRTGKIMDYRVVKDKDGNDIDVKRVKEPMNRVYWVHCLRGQDYLLRQCLFGEHLLSYYPNAEEVHIVESEKTALICNIVSPDKLFMATGSLYNIRLETMEVLGKRRIILHPDKGVGYQKWDEKRKLDLHGLNVEMDDYMERKNFPDGADIGDALIWGAIKNNNKQRFKNGKSSEESKGFPGAGNQQGGVN